MNKIKKQPLVYLAFDGDNIGNEIERLILINDTDGLKKFSTAYTKHLEELIKKILQFPDSSLIFEGGDNFMISVREDKSLREYTKDCIQNFRLYSGTTISLGTGKTAREAFYSLKYAKASGKNKITHFEEFE